VVDWRTQTVATQTVGKTIWKKKTEEDEEENAKKEE
jgi:hypothetical protein